MGALSDELGRWWRREIDRRFADMLHQARAPEAVDAVPAIESFVKDGNLIVRADVPGLEPKDIELMVLDDVLTIKGERKDEKEIGKDDYLHREVAYGGFERRVMLPQGADPEQIRASFKNGVIEVTMPIAKAVAAKKIPLEVGPMLKG